VVTSRGALGELGRISADIFKRRGELGKECATEAWRAAGGHGAPPEWLVQTFAVSLSAFSTTAWKSIASVEHRDAATIVARGLLAIVTEALAEQRLTSSP
jgi:hypothetical protein